MEQNPNPKLIKFKDYKFPLLNPIELTVANSVDRRSPSIFNMATYAYPAYFDDVNASVKQEWTLDEVLESRASSPSERFTNGSYRGIVFYMHGFSEYVGRFAHLG